MENKKNLGIYYGGTNKLNPINFDAFLLYVDNACWIAGKISIFHKMKTLVVISFAM